MLFLGFVSALVYVTLDGRFIAMEDGKMVLSPDERNSVDIRQVEAAPEEISSILSIGAAALWYDKNQNRIGFKDLDLVDQGFLFKVVLLSSGAVVFQNDGRCVGVGETGLTLVNCSDYDLRVEVVSADVFKKTVVLEGKKEFGADLGVSKDLGIKNRGGRVHVDKSPTLPIHSF